MTHTPARVSAWDTPTPSHSTVTDEPSFSRRHGVPEETPLPTPTHRYNAWADDRKSFGVGSGGGGGGNHFIVILFRDSKYF